MTSRSDIEKLIATTYKARHANDSAAIGPLFAEECSFRIVANDRLAPLSQAITGKAAVLEMVAALSQAWDMTELAVTNTWIDGDTAIVRRAGAIRYVPTGAVVNTVLLDIVRVKDGRITGFEEFVDTDLIHRTVAGG